MGKRETDLGQGFGSMTARTLVYLNSRPEESLASGRTVLQRDVPPTRFAAKGSPEDRARVRVRDSLCAL
jgi:hypothetical protein